jgi:uncharacterized protein (TIGR02611 family)
MMAFQTKIKEWDHKRHLWRESIKDKPIPFFFYRFTIILVSALIIVIGIIGLPAPGPGSLIIFAGLSLLATEVLWAKRQVRFIKLHFLRVRKWARIRWTKLRGK